MDRYDLIYYNSHDLFFKNPFGAVPCDKEITIRIQIDKEKNIDYVNLVISFNGKQTYFNMHLESTKTSTKIYKCTFNSSSTPTLMFYFFEISINNKIKYFGNNLDSLGGIGEIYETYAVPYQITVYAKNSATPNWFKHSIIYQIFVDRFYNGNDKGLVLNPKRNSFIYGNWYDEPMYIKDYKTNQIIRWDFFGGNLKGIIKKLDYLKKLGINLIYLNPIFEAKSNHKYDTGNYKKIDPMFGTEKIFKKLIKEAKDRGIYIILDGVFSHTGSDSIYFNKFNNYNTLGAYQSKNSPYFSWYTFKNYPNDYDCWWGVEDLPNVNEMDRTYIDYIIKDSHSVINHWMNLGIKGWRLDVADELPDEFIEEIKKSCLQKDNESILIGEVWEDASNKISYGKRRKYFLGNELDSVTNYPFRENLLSFFHNKINSKELHEKFMKLYENYPIHNFYSVVNVIGTHDIERIFTMLKKAVEKNYIAQISSSKFIEVNIDCKYSHSYIIDDIPIDEDKAKYIAVKLLKLITLIQFTFPGVPLLYYGDEAGVEGLKDPYNRSTYPWGRENKEILNWYKTIIQLRNKNAVLRTSTWKSLYFDNDVYGYIRTIKSSKDVFNNPEKNSLSIILINRNGIKNHKVKIDLNNYDYSGLVNILNHHETINIQNGILNTNLNPLEGKLYINSI